MWKTILLFVLLYYAYVTLGGIIFLLLESVREFNIADLQPFNKTYEFSDIEAALLRRNISKQVIEEALDNWDAVTSFGFIDQDVQLSSLTWTYFNGFLFAFHLCSTIGYGYISPATTHGQMLVILYGILGVPLHLTFNKTLVEAFAAKYEKLLFLIEGEEAENIKKHLLAVLAFFVPWTLILWIIPTIIFMFTENWSFIESLYYTIVTLTTVGLGDYKTGSRIPRGIRYGAYKTAHFVWAFHGLAFTSMTLDYITRFYQRHLLFDLTVDWKKCRLKIERIYIDIERLDLHYKLLKLEGMRAEFSLFAVRRVAAHLGEYKQMHLMRLLNLTNKLHHEIRLRYEERREELEEPFESQTKNPTITKSEGNSALDSTLPSLQLRPTQSSNEKLDQSRHESL